ncbi:MAG: tRNA (N(6)-L-threonylcarbamoyladenosine(37)-C(2))-methylthiotransferase MtaB, partial [Clostridia bacterium]|nr:tRNA (N(6)-L-threonylcarbamoyladenosine(37)-C(2))-methylthiotransferase MtaB [Clostridia bacterium]
MAADALARLRAAIPHVQFTTDIMVGFPGETEEEFEASLDFARRIAFARAHIFAYSRRPGTPAAAMPHQVPAAEKTARARRMSEVCETARAAYETALLGSETSILLETSYPDGYTDGHTPTYIPVRVKTDKTSGELIRVRLTGRDKDYCVGVEV